MNPGYNWILAVLADLKDYCEQNALSETAMELENTLEVFGQEVAKIDTVNLASTETKALAKA